MNFCIRLFTKILPKYCLPYVMEVFCPTANIFSPSKRVSNSVSYFIVVIILFLDLPVRIFGLMIINAITGSRPLP